MSVTTVSPSSTALRGARPEDREHLRLLAVFHYVLAGLAALISCIFLVHFGLGTLIAFDPQSLGGGDPAPRFVGGLLMVLGAAALLLGWGLAGCLVYAGRSLLRAERYTFCLVVAAVSCAFAPFGTVLGVFTLLVLLRPSVKELFGVALPAAATPAEGAMPAAFDARDSGA